MSHHALIGLAAVTGAILLVLALIAYLPLRPVVRQLLVAGLALRVIGALAYLYGITAYYGGGDYALYYEQGLAYAEQIWDYGFPAISDGPAGARSWWGTAFVVRVTGLLLSLIGPSLTGAFVVFALLGYIGLLATAVAFTRTYPAIEPQRFLVWVILFPSLWFWPSALGKDALVLLGIGVAVLGFVGRSRRISWIPLTLGTALVFFVRPQVAATLSFGFVCAHWIASARSWTLGRVVQGVTLGAIGFAVVAMSSGSLGFDLFSTEQVETYLQDRSTLSSYGGSSLAVGEDGVGMLMAPVNVLLRPFPWEARGISTAIAAIEILSVWVFAWLRRHDIRGFLRHHAGTRLFWAGIAFIILYSVALGLSVGNLGIIARQRIHILPFVFVLFAGPARRRADTPAADSVTASVAAS